MSEIEDKEHPYKTGSDTFYMDPKLLISIGVKIDEICVVCGSDLYNKEYYVHAGLIHCIPCALQHKHITREEVRKK